jgi:UDP-GlcNAc:undecaprenyl-phosphate GlcNAc-1-phosphate transferase
MNFVNWSKGVDGQMPGFVGIAAIILGLVAYKFTGHEISATAVSLLAFATSGAFFGFLKYNRYPQKIMPGYGGGALAGYLLAVLSILSWAKLGTLFLVLSMPLVDAFYVILRRLKDLKSPFKGDAGHFHHRLLTIGWGKTRIALFYWFVWSGKGLDKRVAT